MTTKVIGANMRRCGDLYIYIPESTISQVCNVSLLINSLQLNSLLEEQVLYELQNSATSPEDLEDFFAFGGKQIIILITFW